MMNFCKKSFNTLFTTAFTTFTPPQQHSPADHHRISPLDPVADCGAGLNFLATSTETPKSNHVIDSSSLINNIPVKSDHIETGHEVLSSGDTDKLASCTESLGFESCNEMSLNNNVFESSEKARAKGSKPRKFDTKSKEIKSKSFPPPLSSFNGNGKPTFFLRPVRNNGRLELTEVKINWPERLRASRENGRLRLHLVKSYHKIKDDVRSSDRDDEKVVKGWQLPTSSGAAEDCRRVHEQRNMHGWGQQCVSIR